MAIKRALEKPPHNPFPGWGLYFLGLVILNLLPIWVFPFVPSQDGPAHLDSAIALRALASGDAFFHEYYDAYWRIASNQIYLLLLVGLGSFFPMLIAEKLILSLYVIMLPVAMLFAIRQLRTGNLHAVFLAFPLIYSYIFQLGFYNYCLGLIFFLFAIGLYVNFTRIPTIKNSLILSIALFITYFLHVFVAACTILAIGSMAVGRSLWPVVTRWLEPRAKSSGLPGPNGKEVGLLTLSIAPVMIAMITFLASTETSTFKEGASLLSSLTQSQLIFTIHPRLLLSQTFTTFSLVDLTVSLPWHLLLVSLAGIAVLKRRQLHDGKQHGFLAFAVAVFFVLILVIPGHIGSISFLFGRCQPYFYFLFILWLATKPLTPSIWRHAAVLAIVISAANVAYRIPIYADLNHDLVEFTSAAAHIDDNSTVLPVILGNSVFNGLAEMHPRVRFNHMKHAIGYITQRHQIANLVNYQAFMGYFPIQYRDKANTHLRPAWADSGELEVDFDAYEATTGRHVDYVLLWGPTDEEKYQKILGSLLRELSGKYTLVYVSEPRGLMRVYRAKTLPSIPH